MPHYRQATPPQHTRSDTLECLHWLFYRERSVDAAIGNEEGKDMGAASGFTKELRALLEGENAHTGFDDAISGLPTELRGKRPKGLPYSAWELLEHMRIAQNDILEFSRDPDYESPEWPEGYWPSTPEPPNARAWNESIRRFREDREAMLDLVERSSPEDLVKPFAHGSGQTLLREVLLVADHTAYHLGQFIALRRLLGAWKDKIGHA